MLCSTVAAVLWPLWVVSGFEQGYTTGDDSTGLGLAIVRQIVAGHDWAIDVTDSDSGGARFEIRTTGMATSTRSTPGEPLRRCERVYTSCQ